MSDEQHKPAWRQLWSDFWFWMPRSVWVLLVWLALPNVRRETSPRTVVICVAGAAVMCGLLVVLVELLKPLLG